ncbi:MAG: tetratricopeptide repeat protein [Burkholderiaceae bacterium]
MPREHLELALKTLKAIDARTEDLPRAGLYLARTWESAGEYARAEPYYVEAVAAAEKNFGKGSYVAAFAYDNYGDMLRHLHRFEEAEKFVRAATTNYQALYGPDHVNVAMANTNLGLILVAEGKRAEADQRMEVASKVMHEKRGPNDRTLSYFRLHRARAAVAAGQFELARSLHDATLSSDYAKEAENLRQTVITGIWQAQILIMLNRLDEAAGYLDRATTVFKDSGDAGSTREVRLFLRRAELANAQKAGSGTEYSQRAFDLVLSLGENASDLLAETVFSFTQQLPSAESAKQTLARLEPLPLVKTLRSAGTLSVDEAIQLYTSLARLEQASGDLAAAGQDFDRALALRTKHDDPASPWLAQLHGMRAEYFLRAGDPAKARAALDQAQAVKSIAALPYFTQPLARARAELATR